MQSVKLLYKRKWHILLLILLFSLSTVSVTFASSPYWTEGGDLSEYGREMYRIWSIVGNRYTGFAMPLAAISICIGAFKMFGDEKSMAAGKKQILITILALVAIMILPAVVKMGADLGIEHGWDPSAGTAIS